MYICKNTSCALAISKAAFPVAMNCPVCQQALIEVIERTELSEEDELLVSNLPYLIAYPLKRALLEKHAWTKINLLKDTFLNYIKYLGLIAASEFFNSPLKDKKMVALFQQALAEPSFGSWNQYIRETLSSNWKRSAAMYNQENVLSTNDKILVNKFSEEFNKLWLAWDKF